MSAGPELDILGGFAPVGLQELQAAADLQNRRDRKYLVPHDLVLEVLADVRDDARPLVIDNTRLFRYESVYFDTADRASYLAAARRRPRRFKVRTRAYVETGDCVLEVKSRGARGQTVKHRFPHDIERRRDLSDREHELVRQVEPTVETMGELVPTLTTTYKRMTLLIPSGPARLTVDLDVAWQHENGCRVALPGVALVETKTAGPPSSVDRALWRRGRRPQTFSKYCTGLAALDRGLPANKWNRILRERFDWRPAR